MTEYIGGRLTGRRVKSTAKGVPFYVPNPAYMLTQDQLDLISNIGDIDPSGVYSQASPSGYLAQYVNPTHSGVPTIGPSNLRIDASGLDFQFLRAYNLPYPSGDTDAVSKEYVDALYDPSGVSGPGASTDNALALWDGTDGTDLKDSTWTMSGADLLPEDGADLGDSSHILSSIHTASVASDTDPLNITSAGSTAITTTDGDVIINLAGSSPGNIYIQTSGDTRVVIGRDGSQQVLKITNGYIHLTGITAPGAPDEDEYRLYMKDADPSGLYIIGQDNTERRISANEV
jgi:hypothetical protein